MSDTAFVNWVIDNLASQDVIDLYFILSDLVDIELSELELNQQAVLDSLSNHTLNQAAAKMGLSSNNFAPGSADEHHEFCKNYNGNIPLGKLVL